jgi:hypothetical protein
MKPAQSHSNPDLWTASRRARSCDVTLDASDAIVLDSPESGARSSAHSTWISEEGDDLRHSQTDPGLGPFELCDEEIVDTLRSAG